VTWRGGVTVRPDCLLLALGDDDAIYRWDVGRITSAAR
jgi:hypothetical protein